MAILHLEASYRIAVQGVWPIAAVFGAVERCPSKLKDDLCSYDASERCPVRAQRMMLKSEYKQELREAERMVIWRASEQQARLRLLE